jgi:hypothetical protein
VVKHRSLRSTGQNLSRGFVVLLRKMFPQNRDLNSAVYHGVSMQIRESVFSPVGVIGWGSIPLAFVGSIALLLILLRYASIRLVPLAHENSNKEKSMVKTLTARTRFFLSSMFETLWAIGVSSVAGLHLLA